MLWQICRCSFLQDIAGGSAGGGVGNLISVQHNIFIDPQLTDPFTNCSSRVLSRMQSKFCCDRCCGWQRKRKRKLVHICWDSSWHRSMAGERKKEVCVEDRGEGDREKTDWIFNAIQVQSTRVHSSWNISGTADKTDFRVYCMEIEDVAAPERERERD